MIVRPRPPRVTWALVSFWIAACSGAPGEPSAVQGTVSNLKGTGLVLQVNGRYDLTVPAGASTFRFAVSFVEGASYEVTVLTQPSDPPQVCAVKNGQGTVGSGNDLRVECVTEHEIAGKVQGLAREGLQLHLAWEGGAGEDLSVSPATPGEDAPFAFSSKVPVGASYSVTVTQDPLNLTCTVPSGGEARMDDSEVTDVNVVCACSAVAGMATTEYQCIDFDGEMPAWTETVSGTGALSRSSELARSPGYSLKTSVENHADGVATITWRSAGASEIQSVSVSAAIAPVLWPQGVAVATAGINIFCIVVGNITICLSDTVNTGLELEWVYDGTVLTAARCPLSFADGSTATFASSVWNTAALTLRPGTGVIEVAVNNFPAIGSCAGTPASAGAVAEVTVGLSANCGDRCPPWIGYFDDIVAVVQR
jgi:hypothetical protein